MRALLFLILAFVGLYFVYTGLQPTTTIDAVPARHAHTTAANAGTNTSTATTGSQARTASVVFDRDHAGYQTYRQRGCNVCHGADLLGSRMGPSLADAREHWDRESLANYLANPDAFIKSDERLQRLDTEFARFVMPAFDDMTEEELQGLAGLILEPKPSGN